CGHNHSILERKCCWTSVNDFARDNELETADNRVGRWSNINPTERPLWTKSGHVQCNSVRLIEAESNRTPKAQQVAVGVFDGELTEAVRKVLRTPFGLTVPLNSVPQRINIIDGEILGCRCVGLSEMRIVHKHNGNAVTA